jgi:oxygen-independent coproporphyrinogen-3 oxidase
VTQAVPQSSTTMTTDRPPLWPYHGDLLATPVPRYTSYPTAAEFHDDMTAADMAEGLRSVGRATPVSLYLHIPYCREICWYCGCNTGAANRTGRLDAYLDALHAEIDLVASTLDGRGRIGRIAFGGGSPNAIAPAQFDALVRHLRDAFSLSRPILSVEVDPRGFDAEWAGTLGRNGVTRASLGVQTFAPRLQAAIGRVQPAELIEQSVALLRGAGVTSLNFDLMYGLPGQTDADLADTLAQAVALAPDRLAVFGYAHVPHLIPRQRRIDASELPDTRARFGQAALAHAELTRSGYLPVGFDHFALPGDALAVATADGTLRRNFQGFTEDQADVLIGLGATAISSFPDRLLQNEKNVGHYRMLVGGALLPVQRGLRRTEEDRRRAQVIAQILTKGHVAAQLLTGMDDAVERLTPFLARGLARLNAAGLTLAHEALPYARSIACAFDQYRGQAAARFSSAV